MYDSKCIVQVREAMPREDRRLSGEFGAGLDSTCRVGLGNATGVVTVVDWGLYIRWIVCWTRIFGFTVMVSAEVRLK